MSKIAFLLPYKESISYTWRSLLYDELSSSLGSVIPSLSESLLNGFKPALNSIISESPSLSESLSWFDGSESYMSITPSPSMSLVLLKNGRSR